MPLPSEKLKQEGCPEGDGPYCWGESKAEEMERRELSPVYHQELSLEGQVRQQTWEGEGDGGRWRLDVAYVYVTPPVLDLSHAPLTLQEGDCLFRLKDIAFHTLSKLLRAGEVKCGFISKQDRTDLLR